MSFKCGGLHRVFSALTGGNMVAQHYWSVNSRTGEPLLSLLSPETYEPLPGMVTGMFFSANGKTFYVTGLGNALMRY